MSWAERLAAERRLRLAAEAMTRQREAELKAARTRLSEQAQDRARPAPVLPLRPAPRAPPPGPQTDPDSPAHTAAVQAERQLWDAIEAMGEGFAVFDANGRLIGANAIFRDLFSGDATAFPAGQTLAAILDAAAVGKRIEPVGDIAPGSAAIDVALCDGRILCLTRQPTRDGGQVCLAMDVTEATRQAAALSEASTAAESASQAKSAFLANMSHELRTPLNGVLGMAEMLCDSALPAEPRLFADTIRTSAEALLRLIDDVLNYSRLQAGRIALRHNVFEIDALLHEVALMLAPAARLKGLTLEVDCDLFLPERLVGDPGRLRQVVVNLVGNAVKFTTDGEVRLCATGHPAGDSDGLMVHITVMDTGIGIAPEHHDHIFAEFAQVEASHNRAFDGAGLGLAICRDLVTAMAGEIWVDSVPGDGACFGFCVPLRVSTDAPQTVLRPVPSARVLLLDDRPMARNLTQWRLTPLGLTLLEDGDPHDAMSDKELDAIVMHADHSDRLAALRASGCDAPVVLMSDALPPEGEWAAVLPAAPSRRALLGALGAVLAPGADHGGPMRVLSAEDNRTNQLVFAKMLRDLDIELRFAADGHEAVAQFRAFRPDLVFMDISMPGMDGREATRAIRAIEADAGTAPVPIIALTAHALNGDREDILAAGLDDYLSKPLRRAAICEQITRHCPPGRRPVQPAPQPVAEPPRDNAQTAP